MSQIGKDMSLIVDSKYTVLQDEEHNWIDALASLKNKIQAIPNPIESAATEPIFGKREWNKSTKVKGKPKHKVKIQVAQFTKTTYTPKPIPSDSTLPNSGTLRNPTLELR